LLSDNRVSIESSSPLNLGRTQGAGGDISGVEGKDYKSGEVLVKFKPHVSKGELDKIAGISGLGLMKVVYPPNLILFQIMGSSSVKDVIQSLKMYEEIEYAEPNYNRKPF
jgi:Fervidolysin N-terminal prodomain